MSTEPNKSIRERLIEEGIKEISMHGVRDFSVRRVATACGVSCAAPYKHFSDKNSFVAGIIEHVVRLWEEKIPEIVSRHDADDLPEQLTEISVEYVKFLVQNSYFRSIIMVNDPEFDEEYADLRHRLTNTSRELILKYRDQVEMPYDTFGYKLYIVRSLIYGAALMLDNGEMEYNEKTIEFVRRAIRREFDLP